MKRYGLLLCVLMLALAGCGGGGGNGGGAMPDAIVEQPEPEPERQPGPEPEPELEPQPEPEPGPEAEPEPERQPGPEPELEPEPAPEPEPGPEPSPEPRPDLDELLQDLQVTPAETRAERILEQADTVLIPGVYVSGTITAQGITESFAVFEPISCSPIQCVTLVDISEDLVGSVSGTDPAQGEDIAEAVVTTHSVTLASHSGFDVGEMSETLNLMRAVSVAPGFSLTRVDAEMTTYGLWGEYGWAGVMVMAGHMAGSVEGEGPFSTDLEVIMAMATGNASGTNPAGLGRATWEGVAEAVDTSTFERRQGTATVTIPELSEPLVGVGINVPGYAIGSPDWAAMPLHDGRFAFGVDGRFVSGGRSGTSLEGNFHGPEHSEVYGVFDTGDYTGAFGARR